MDEKILAIYCLCNDLLKALHHVEDRQHKMTEAEILPTALGALVCFGGNFEQARALLNASPYRPTMLSRSRCKRRLPQIEDLLVTFLDVLGQTWQDLNVESVDILESFPVAICDNSRLPRVKV